MNAPTTMPAHIAAELRSPGAGSELIRRMREFIARYGGEDTSTLLLYEAHGMLCRMQEDVKKARADLLDSDRPVAYLDWLIAPEAPAVRVVLVPDSAVRDPRQLDLAALADDGGAVEVRLVPSTEVGHAD